MPIYVRKNLVTISLAFTALDGSGTQPSGANMVLTYKDLGGASHNADFPLVYSSDTNTWDGSWDSSASGDGTVHWMAYGYGALQAAAQGEFVVSANPANTV